MSATDSPTVAPERGATIIEVREIGKRYGNIIALSDVSTSVRAGEVTCVLGDNGAGKSTFIKILAGAHEHSDGELLIDGEPVHLASPRAALELGIATVYQDLAVVPLMPVWRNFFLGSEVVKGFGPFKKLDICRVVRQTVRCRAEIHRQGPRAWTRRRLHHPQPAPRISGGGSLHAAAPRQEHG